ncbi:MAG: S41 family peptidase [Brevundimonas sp.]
MRAALIFLAGLILALASPALARDVAGAPTTAQGRHDTVEALEPVLRAWYAFPQAIDPIMAALRDHLARGDYAALDDPGAFARALSADLVEAGGDLHFSIGYDPDWVSAYRAAAAQSTAVKAFDDAVERPGNYGFQTVALLDGNVGYVRLDHFSDPGLGYETATAAMRFVENADALIFDMRYNGGGSLEMAQLIASYLFSGDRDVELFHYFYNGDDGRVERSQWVLAALPGKRLPDIPVYVLTGTTSFSAAEWFSYTLAKHGRATLVGQVTAGGAHPVDRKPLEADFFVQVPIGQIREPLTGTDFETVGVQPDRPTPSWRALDVAHAMALERLAAMSPGSAAVWFLPVVKARLSLPTDHADLYRRAAGSYEGRQLVVENGALIYRWRDRFSLRLEPLGDDLFAVEGTSDYRFHLVSEGGRVVALERMDQGGERRLYPRLDPDLP